MGKRNSAASGWKRRDLGLFHLGEPLPPDLFALRSRRADRLSKSPFSFTTSNCSFALTEP